MTKPFLTGVVAAAALAVTFVADVARAQSPPASGMLLGVYVFENQTGLRVTGTIPGYSAEGRLFANDVLMQATPDGVNIYSIRTRQEIEWAKDQIGPYTPAAIEVWRPGVGTIYFWVEFHPVGVGPTAAVVASGAPRQMKAQFKTEAEKPGARALFQRGGGLPTPPQGQTPRLPRPSPGTPPHSPSLSLPGGVKLNPGMVFGRLALRSAACERSQATLLPYLTAPASAGAAFVGGAAMP